MPQNCFAILGHFPLPTLPLTDKQRYTTCMYPTTLGKFGEPRTIVSHFHLREGDTVADFGAGSGHYMKPLSDAVGRSGVVYLCEIQKNLVESLGDKKRDAHISNVYPLWCDIEKQNGIKIKDGVLNAGLLSNVLFQFIDKERALEEIGRTICKGGKLFVIDWLESFGNMGPRVEDIVSESEAKSLLKNAGFSFEHSFPVGDHHYGLMFRKL